MPLGHRNSRRVDARGSSETEKLLTEKYFEQKGTKGTKGTKELDKPCPPSLSLFASVKARASGLRLGAGWAPYLNAETPPLCAAARDWGYGSGADRCVRLFARADLRRSK